MIREALYHKTVGILVDAYFNDTLEHSNCHACAVGNIIAANMSVKLAKSNEGAVKDKNMWVGNIGPAWQSVHMVMTNSKHTTWSSGGYLIQQEGQTQINFTGYAYWETADIELAFETADKGKDSDEWMFNGLMAVIEVLDKIHENTDIQVQQESKNRFLKAV